MNEGSVRMKTKFVIPKGHLGNGSQILLETAGYKISGLERTYRPNINDDDIELKIMRPQEIPILVAEGVHDIGITGKDWISETRADVKILLDLEFGWTKMVMAVPNEWNDINTLSDLLQTFWAKKQDVRISTEYLNTAVQFIQANPVYQKQFQDATPVVITPWWRIGDNPQLKIFLSFGATEAKPPENAEAIIEVTETGTTLEQNNLKIIETLGESTAVLIANKTALKNPEKREKIIDIYTLLHGAVDGRKKIHIFVNVKQEHLDTLVTALPALKRPTISPLSEPGWFSINTVIERTDFLQLLPKLRQLSQGLVVHVPRQILSLKDIFDDESDDSIPED
jgi:ATP phosphoribosyltransferase